MRTDPPHTEDDVVSLPLYAAGLIVTLSGILTVTAELDSGGVGRITVLLAVIGFAFSLACRRLQVSALWLHLGSLVFVACLIPGAVGGGFSNAWFFGGAGTPDLRLAVLLMWVSVLRSWTLVSDDLVLSCCVTTAAMIGLIGTQTPNTEVAVYFCLFILAMTFLLIHQNYLHFRAVASARERTRPAGLMLMAQAALTLFSVLCVLSAGALLIVPAQAVFANLSLSQAIRRLVGNRPNRDALAASGANQFSDTTNLDIGLPGQWPTGSNVLMHVAPDDQQPHYWRGRTYDQYWGTAWRSNLGSRAPLPTGGDVPQGRLFWIRPGEADSGRAETPPLARSPMSAVFDVLGDTDQFYYCAEPRTMTLDAAPDVVPTRSADGRIDLDGRRVTGTYSFTSLPQADLSLPDVQRKLRRDGAAYPSEVRRLYLPVSWDEGSKTPNLDDYRAVVADVLRGLPPDRRTPFDKAAALRDWVANRCTYSLSVPTLPSGTDSVHEFLFHTRRGYCDLFASSFVILCRVADIPARVATGFAPGDRDETGFNLRALDKHAWAEVYFPGDGWEVFDPTVGTRADDTIPVRETGAGGWWQRLLKTLRGSPLPLALGAIIALLLLFVLKTEVYDRIRRATPVGALDSKQIRGRLDDQYDQMTQALARLGLPRRPSETPAEFEARAVPFLSALEGALGVSLTPFVVREATRRLVAVRYAGSEAAGDSGFDAAFARWTRAASRARLRQLWQRLMRHKR